MSKKMRFAPIFALFVLSVTALCQQAGAPWPKLRQNVLNTGVGLGGGVNGAQKWVYPAGIYNTLAPAVIAADGTIYFGSAANLLALLPDGNLKWSFKTGSQIYNAPGIGADGTIVFGSDDFKIYAVNPDGTKKWSYPTGSVISSAPSFATDGTIYIGSADSYLYALTPAGGLKWKFFAGSGVSSSPAVAPDGTILVGNNYGSMFAINPDGTQKWVFDTGSTAGIVSAPAISPNGTIYFGSWNHKLYALNPDGTMQWTFPTGNLIWTSPVIATDGTIYIGSDDHNLYAVNPDGTQKWKFTAGRSIEASPAIGSDGTIYFGSMDWNVYALNPDGTQLWSFATGGFVNYDPAIGSDGTIYVGSGDFKFYAIGSKFSTVPILSVSLKPTSVIGGGISKATVTLAQAAPAGGDLITIQSSSTAAVPPASITIPAGQTTAQFTVGTSAVTTTTAATIVVTSGSSSQSAVLTVLPPSILAGLALNPNSIVGGNSTTGTVTLNGAAPLGGTAVTLNSSGPNVSVQATVTVPEGSTSATFTAITLGVPTQANESITASLNNAVKTATLTLLPAGLSTFTVTPNTVVGGVPSVGTLGLNGAAPATGVVISLSSNSVSTTVPGTATVPAGSTSTTFPIKTTVVIADAAAVIAASQGSTTLKQNFMVQTPQLIGVTVGPNPAVGGSNTVMTGTVNISGAAPSGGETVMLTSSVPATVKLPAYVKVLSGNTSATFTVAHKSVPASKEFTITGKLGTHSSTAHLTLDPFLISGISVAPNVVTGGQTATGTITLNATPSSGSGAITAKVTSTSTAVSLPVSVSVPVGSKTKTFTVTTKAVGTSTSATIVAKVGTSTQQTGITIQQSYLASVSVKPTTIKGSATTAVTGTVTLSGPAPTGGLTVSLSSSSTSAAGVPATVKVLAGKTTATFKVSHSKVQAQASVTISGNLAGVIQTATLTVTP